MSESREEPGRLGLTVRVGGSDELDPTDLDDITRALRRELEDLGLDPRAPTAGAPAPGAKGLGEAFTMGSLLLQVLPGAVPALLDFLKGWVTRPGGQPVTIDASGPAGSLSVTFDPATTSADEVRRLAADLQGLVK